MVSDEFRHWLDGLGLGAHAATFADNDIDFDSVPLLSEADLKELGLSLGHRRILQRALEQRDVRRVAPSGAAHPTDPQGERRQITVMFCDLVGSTELSSTLDPEDLRSLIHAYYSSCCRIIEESGGFIARIVGDGILAYFGYPAAREDAAECAIRAGLRVVASVGGVHAPGTGRIDVRIGLATGMSVISDMVGVGFSELHAVLGETPNIAARIQSLAEPGTVAIADSTRRLAGGFFAYSDAGRHQVKGISRPLQVWHVLGESRSSARFDAQRSTHVECIGRTLQLQELQVAWDEVRAGACRVVALVGEAGIGKSLLLRTASDRLVPSPGWTALMQCSPSQATSPLHPIVEWLRRDMGLGVASSAEDPDRITAWLGPSATPLDRFLIAELLGIPAQSDDAPPVLPPDRRRDLTREIVLRHVEGHCEAAPGLLMVEDAHWMDGATEAFLVALRERLLAQPLLIVVTSRPAPLGHWAAGAHARTIGLEPLPAADAEQLVRATCRGRNLPPAILGEILSKTDGVPLFIEELTATILESGLLQRRGDDLVLDGQLPALDIPSTLRDSLMARLDRLSDIKEVARLGSAIGREFTFSLLAHVSEQPADRLVAALDRLVEAQLLFQRGVPPHAEYTFKHSLVQQAAYDSQLRSDRQAVHARIVHAIETHQPDTVRREPGLMAHHCQLAGMTDREVDYLHAAGLASTRMVAIPQALDHFSRADVALAGLPTNARNARRNIQVILGMMEVGRFAILPSRLMALSERARDLSRMDGVDADAETTSAILFQEGRAKLYTSRYSEARDIFREMQRLGAQHDSTSIERKPASAFSMGLCCQGLFNETLAFINEGNIGYYKQAGSFIDYISGLGWIAYASCQAGPGDAGLVFGQRSVDEAANVQSQIYLAGAYIWRSHALMSVRRLDEAVADAQQCVALSEAHGVPYLGWHGLVFLALCQCRNGDLEGAAQSLAKARALLAQAADGCWSLLDYLPAIEAEIACCRGDGAEAIRQADEAIAIAREIGGHFAEAIAWRAKALGCLRSGGGADEAQAFFDRAMRKWDLGGANAESAFSALVWAHALQGAGHAERARRWAELARATAQRHGFDLRRCEHGAAVLAQAPPS